MTENTKNNGVESTEMTPVATNVVGMENTTATVEKTAEINEGVYTHKFKKPFEYAGATYKELTFNFERLTGNDMISIETEMATRSQYALAPEISRNFQSKMAAKAAGIGSDVLEVMPLVDFNKITNAARDFLLNTGY
ncbi:MAG: phage tail assembly protein [Anaerotignum propionicum]|uniref:phage tail assembly protein n=1 Tax=Anaerotignum propionicum TaxID=28446 RepID=UPI002B1EA190|nr:phage tail assembly protein [Anaerotignum propionicum]MEA5057774.1 phage tail assembly protein [Anaerotignum propionicum]